MRILSRPQKKNNAAAFLSKMNKKMVKPRMAKILKLSLLIFCFFSLTYAEAATVRINPTKVRLVIPPGESKSGVIEVENPSEESLIVRAYLQDWRYTDLADGTKEFFPAGTTSFSAADWISISLNEFVIPAFGKQKINFTAKVPQDAQGGHYAVLFFESLLGKPEFQENAQLGVMVRIGALFYIEPEGSIKRMAEVNRFFLDQGQDKSLKISLGFNNTGNVDITSKATFHIIDDQGNVLARGDFNDIYTLPGNTAELTATWKEALPKGTYDSVFTFDLGMSLEQKETASGPVITKEAQIEIGPDGKLIKVGELK